MTDMAKQAEPGALRLSAGTDALWESVVEAPLASVTVMHEGAERSFSACVAAMRWVERAPEGISSSLLYNVLKVTGRDIHLKRHFHF